MGKTIVWIEDDTDVIDAVVRPLERAGHHIIRLSTMQDALDAIDALRQSDLILLDATLPLDEGLDLVDDGLDPADQQSDRLPYCGLRLLHQLRQSSSLNTPVIVLSTLNDPRLHHALRSLNIVDALYMPIKPSELQRRVEAVWETRSIGC